MAAAGGGCRPGRNSGMDAWIGVLGRLRQEAERERVPPWRRIGLLGLFNPLG